ncbi:MAG: FAD-binding protein, partial [Cyanobium sp. MAG_237]|nr:FAD-binding protein [Cyanobium sp. MAG_237]
MLAAPSCHPALRQGVGLQPFTTWKVGGPAEWFAEPGEVDELVSLAAWAQAQGLSLRCIGAGSNLLIADSGLPGLTICNRRLQGSRLDAASGLVEAEAGEPIPSLARKA